VKKHSILLFSLFLLSRALCQDTSKINISALIESINNANATLAIEKLYLQTDKYSYATGDTLWFKAYLLDEAYMNASNKSGLIYLEIVNDSNDVLQRSMVPAYIGRGYGQVTLDRKLMPPGNYYLRAYTNWMRNFGERYIFQKSFSITGTRLSDWIINYTAQIKQEYDQQSVNLRMKIRELDSLPVQLRTLSLRVSDNKRTPVRNEVKTGIDGTLDYQFNLPDKSSSRNITVYLRDGSKQDNANELVVPLQFNRPENIDLQFMPEGGSLVAGLPARVAFKALNEDGLGATISGNIVDSKGKAIVPFHSTHVGMGIFNFFPLFGETYSAVVDLPGGQHKTFPFPAIQSSGITLQVDNDYNKDSTQITIYSTADEQVSNKTHLLLAQARGIIVYGASFKLKNGIAKVAIHNNTFPEGIVRFTVSGRDNRILNERKVFINHNNLLSIQITPHQSSYGLRDSVALDILVKDEQGQPAVGSFSMAVTDDGQVPTDSIKRNSIVSQLLLTGDLKGNIEDPGYYLPGAIQYPERWKELDQLLLTQGWAGYDWNEMEAAAQKLPFSAEPEFAIRGRVTNMFNKPVAGSKVTLLATHPFVMADTITNPKGDFIFTNLMPVDTAVYFLQSVNKRDKKFNVGIEMEEFKPPVFSPRQERIIPWYVNMETARIETINKQIQAKKEMERKTGIKTLEEVIVTAKKVVRDSKNLNGPGEADQVIGEEELKKAGRKSLGDLLRERVKGFGERATKTGTRYYAINSMVVHLVIDGITVERFRPEGLTMFDYFRQYLDYYDAEEIKGIEIMRSGRYQMSYTTEYLDPMAVPWDHAFVEITTRGGVGPFLKKEVGTYLYRPLPFNIPRKFYSPKYTSASFPDKTDIRSTIFWAPDIVTDKEGHATVSFYTADLPGKYSIIMEGSDLQGSIGAGRTSIIVRTGNAVSK